MTSRDKRSWLALGLIFLLALALRVAYLASYAKSPSAAALIGDAETFDAWAQEIARGNWLGNEIQNKRRDDYIDGAVCHR